MSGSGWHAVCPESELAEGQMREHVVAGVGVLMVRSNGELHATTPHCPHKFGALSDGELRGPLLTCPMHTATFDLATGRPRPGEEWAGTLTVYPTRVREGIVEVQFPSLG